MYKPMSSVRTLRTAGRVSAARSTGAVYSLAPYRAPAYHAHMTIFATSAARWLLQATAAHDTVIVRQVAPVQSAFDQVVSIASGISTLLVLVLVTGLVAAMLAVRRSVRRAHDALDHRIAEFGKRLDDFNDLLAKVHKKADAIVEVGAMAADGLKWGARKMAERHSAEEKDDGVEKSPYLDSTDAGK
jgi:hypothetical protein